MPELPEVETIARELDQRVTGRKLGRVEIARIDILHGDDVSPKQVLPGKTVDRVWRRAKRVMIDLRGGGHLVFHLGMSGRLTIEPQRDPLPPHTHLRVSLRGTSDEIRFCDPRRFGGVWLIGDSGAPQRGRSLGPLGLEPLSEPIPVLRRALDRDRQLKALLLDQTVIAGLGNIYCDEALHAARIHPLIKASALHDEQAYKLIREIRAVLRRAIRFRGSTLMDYQTPGGAPGSFQRKHKVYAREGQPCRTCGVPIVRTIVAARSSFWCPSCQPERNAAAKAARPRRSVRATGIHRSGKATSANGKSKTATASNHNRKG